MQFSIGEYYHLYNRGTEKRTIFLDNADIRRFLHLLYLCNDTAPVHMSAIQGSTLNGKKAVSALDQPRSKPTVAIGAYCLMPNHFHLLVKEIAENGISTFMHKISTAYTMYFNKRYERTGSLFQGRFRSSHALSDEYLKYLFAYIHLNPVKLVQPDWKETGIKNRKKTERFLKDYHQSSYQDYVGINRKERKILALSEFPSYFDDGHREFESYLSDWLSFSDPEDFKAQP